jgi:uncharacterized UPF0160 family protein
MTQSISNNKPLPNLTIITHDGFFHMDDLTAYGILKENFKNTHQLTLVRTRNPQLLQEGKKTANTIVMDVGEEFNAELNNFDHHQSNFSEIHQRSKVKKAAAGLIWDKFGPELITKLAPNEPEINKQKIWEDFRTKIIEPIDAYDNGQSVTKTLNKDSNEPIATINAGSLVLAYNNNENPNPENQMTGFLQAAEICNFFIKGQLDQIIKRQKAQRIIQTKYKEKPTPSLDFDENLPWKEAGNCIPHLLHIINKNPANNTFNAVCVGLGFQSRLPFPAAWGGKTEAELQKITNITGMTFCHKSGFMLATTTKEAAIAACELGIKTQKEIALNSLVTLTKKLKKLPRLEPTTQADLVALNWIDEKFTTTTQFWADVMKFNLLQEFNHLTNSSPTNPQK